MFSKLGFIFLLLLAGCEQPKLFPADAILPDGGEYRGDMQNGLFHGKGELIYPNGARYKGYFSEGRFSGDGEWTAANGDRYVGEFLDGSPSENVVLTSQDGSEYRGGMRQWKAHGGGTSKTSGTRYVGEFELGEFHGQGTFTDTSGGRYTGEFKAGKFHGQGVYEYEGTIYEGEFSEGELGGKATITSSDGSVYIGEVSSWTAEGEGQQTDAEGNMIVGQFESGYAQGEGRLIASDGRQYEGGFGYGEFDGQGKLTLQDGSVYEGEFSYGRYHGQGELRTPAKGEQAATLKSGRWRSGVLVYNKLTGEHLADQAEVALQHHQSLLTKAIDDLAASDKGKANAYFLGVAGDGTQSVFRREIEFVAKQIDKRFATQQRSISLINHHDSAALYPMATTRSVAAAIDGIAQKIDPENDVLFLYLSSHGSKTHELSLGHDSINLPPLSAKSLAETVRNSKIKWKVIFVSACYAGGFIPELDDDTTLIMTAADSDNTSFGCSEESDMTYFGKALFLEVLANDVDISLVDAFDQATALIQEWETEQELTPSNPTIKKPKAIVDKLRTLSKVD